MELVKAMIDTLSDEELLNLIITEIKSRGEGKEYRLYEYEDKRKIDNLIKTFLNRAFRNGRYLSYYFSDIFDFNSGLLGFYIYIYSDDIKTKRIATLYFKTIVNRNGDNLKKTLNKLINENEILKKEHNRINELNSIMQDLGGYTNSKGISKVHINNITFEIIFGYGVKDYKKDLTVALETLLKRLKESD